MRVRAEDLIAYPLISLPAGIVKFMETLFPLSWNQRNEWIRNRFPGQGSSSQRLAVRRCGAPSVLGVFQAFGVSRSKSAIISPAVA